MSEVGAAFQALLAAALDAALGLPLCFLLGISLAGGFNAAQLFCGGEIRIQAALHGPLLPARVARIEVLCQPVHRQGGAFRGESSVEYAAAWARDQPLRLADHQLRHAQYVRKQTQHELPRGAEHIKALLFIVEKGDIYRTIKFKLNVLVLQALTLKSKCLFVKERCGGTEPCIVVPLLAEHGDRVGFLLELSCQKQRKEPAAEHGDCLFLLRPKDAAEL